jgi:polyhydroxyalkanoate synthesis repressor PhaR
MDKPNVVIKKYGDRRLYDTDASRYVKLEDIAGMIRQGIDVQVLDAQTGKDLTAGILTQIVVENARDPDTPLPVQFLRQLVMASDQASHEFLSWYLSNTLDVYQKAQQAAEAGSVKLGAAVAEAKRAASSPLEFVRNLLSGHALPPAQDASEVEKLRRKVETLEARLSQVRKPGRRAPRRKKKA